jgi:ferredoxin
VSILFTLLRSTEAPTFWSSFFMASYVDQQFNLSCQCAPEATNSLRTYFLNIDSRSLKHGGSPPYSPFLELLYTVSTWVPCTWWYIVLIIILKSFHGWLFHPPQPPPQHLMQYAAGNKIHYIVSALTNCLAKCATCNYILNPNQDSSRNSRWLSQNQFNLGL